MAENNTTIKASASDVWQAFCDAKGYDRWVVGAKEVRGTSGKWPEVGAELHHTLGAGSLEVVKDKTKVVAVEPEKMLHLKAGMRPFGGADIIFKLKRVPEGTEVTMTEHFAGGFLGRIYGRFVSAQIKARNAEALRRLRKLVEESPSTKS